MRNLSVAVVFLAAVLLYGCGRDQSGFGIVPAGESIAVDIYSLQDQALQIVRRGLADESGLVRSHAIEVVSTTGRKDLMPKVKQLSKSDSSAVRFAAALAVGDMEYSAGGFAVERLLNDRNENARIAAAYAMTRLKKGNFTTMIREAVKSKNQTVRANAVLLLGKLRNTRDLKLLYSVLNAPDSADMVRFQATESIAMVGDEKVYERLWALLISKYADDRFIGIRAMGALATTDAKNAIITKLYDEVPEVRLCAAEQLGRLGDRSGEAEIIEYFTKIPNKPEAVSPERADALAAMAIGRIGGGSLTKFLPRLLQNPSKLVRLSAAQAVLLLAQKGREAQVNTR